MSQENPTEENSGDREFFDIDIDTWMSMTFQERIEHAGILRKAIIDQFNLNQSAGDDGVDWND